MANVLKMALSEAILSLHQRGWSRRRIARELGIDRATVRRHLSAQAEQQETPNAARRTSGLGLHTGMSDDQLAVVKDVVAHQAIKELDQFIAECSTNRFGHRVDLCQAICQAVRDLDIFAPEFLHQLHIVIARHAHIDGKGQCRQIDKSVVVTYPQPVVRCKGYEEMTC